jgi:hypothetical protein
MSGKVVVKDGYIGRPLERSPEEYFDSDRFLTRILERL